MKISRTGIKEGQLAWSVDVKPVVVAKEIVWNNVCSIVLMDISSELSTAMPANIMKKCINKIEVYAFSSLFWE
jgi:hypothetical protein